MLWPWWCTHMDNISAYLISYMYKHMHRIQMVYSYGFFLWLNEYNIYHSSFLLRRCLGFFYATSFSEECDHRYSWQIKFVRCFISNIWFEQYYYFRIHDLVILYTQLHVLKAHNTGTFNMTRRFSSKLESNLNLSAHWPMIKFYGAKLTLSTSMVWKSNN